MKTITRKRHGKGFAYYDGTQKITDSKKVDYYNSLVVPPAWKNVSISVNKRAKILATGKDEAGRTQYIYHPSYRAKQEQAKFERILDFAEALPKMRRVTQKHLQHKKLDKEKVLACIVQLMDQAYFRVGNDVYAKQNQSYGITTLRSKHTEIKRDEVIFDFTGKSGQRHRKKVTDRKLIQVVRQLDAMPGYEIFKYIDENGQTHQIRSSDVNAYIKDIMGEEFSAKDFRTWGGTVLASAEFIKTELVTDTQRERKKAVTACVKKVAKRLGNTPAIARSSYIDPRIIDNFTKGYDYKKLQRTVEKMRRKNHLNSDEQCLLVQLQNN